MKHHAINRVPRENSHLPHYEWWELVSGRSSHLAAQVLNPGFAAKVSNPEYATSTHLCGLFPYLCEPSFHFCGLFFRVYAGSFLGHNLFNWVKKK